MVESLQRHAVPFSDPSNDEEKDAFLRMQELERELEMLSLQEELLKDE
jgi:hypothetical protein